MARIEKTVFISYRRKDISWALAVYQYLTSQKYDVFFDFSSLSSGDFEQVILSNIRARAHFVLILTPTTLDRCDEPGDWIRREIETAIDEKRNIIPLFFDGFNFGLPDIAGKLTGKMGHVRRYNGLDVPVGYFAEAMGRLRSRYLTVPLNAVIHPVPTEVRKVVKQEQVAADKALQDNKQDIQDLVRSADGKSRDASSADSAGRTLKSGEKAKTRAGKPIDRTQLLYYGIGIAVLVGAALGIKLMIQGFEGAANPPPEQTTIPSTSTEQFVIGSTQTSPSDDMIQLYVPAGNFTMGSNDANEGPMHPLFVDAFWIDHTEVTNSMYSECVKDGDCRKPSPPVDYLDPDYTNHPVVFISWNDAKNYCSWANRRLPTEEEWEKAASWGDPNGQKRKYPWGNEFSCANGNFADTTESCDDFPRTSPVGHFSTNLSAYGASDMAGNVWEWVSSLYQPYPYIEYDGREDLEVSGNRVMRGGSWNSNYYEVRSTFRRGDDATRTYSSVGFRCAMDASE